MKRRDVMIIVASVLVILACTATCVFVLTAPAYRTTVLVDTSAPGTGLPQIAGAVRSVVGNSGDSDALSVRRYGGECGNPADTAEIADRPDQVATAVNSLTPAGKATMVDGVAAAIDGFSGLLNRRGTVRNRIVVISTSGIDACTGDPAAARKSIDDRLARAGLDLEIRVVGFQVPQSRQAALVQFAGASNAAFADSADDLKVVLDRLVVPNSPDAASLSVAPPAPEPTYAFMGDNRIGVVRGTKVIAQTAGSFTTTYNFRYTTDGHFVFAVGTAGVTTIDARSGVVRAVSCGNCEDVAAAGGSVISWLAGHVVTTLDLGDPKSKPAAGVTVLPDRQVDDTQQILPLRILAAKDGNTLVSAPDGVSAYGGGNENLYLARADGQLVSIGIAQGNVAVGEATFSPDGRFVAYRAAAHSGACETVSSVVVINIATHAQNATPSMGADLNNGGAAVDDLWYDKDGTLNMIYNSWRCDTSGGPQTSVDVPDSHWQLRDSRWAQRDAGYSRDVGPGFRAVLGNPDSQTYKRELFSEVNGARTKIADDAVAIAVPN
jgi:hypothetical protein